MAVDPLSKYYRSYVGGGRDPLEKYYRKYSPAPEPVLLEPEPEKEGGLFQGVKNVGGILLNAPAAAAGLIAGKLVGDGVYERELARKMTAHQQAGIFGEGAQAIEEAPRVSDLVFSGYEPKTPAARSFRNVVGLTTDIATDPLSFVGGMGGRGLGLAATALYGPQTVKGAYVAGKGAFESLGEGEYGEAGVQGVEAVLMGGLSALMAKGLIDEKTAFNAMRAKRGQKLVDEAKPRDPPDSFFGEEEGGPAPVAAAAASPVPAVFQEPVGEAPAPRGRVMVGAPDGTLTAVETRPRTFVQGPEGVVIRAPQVALGEVPAVFGDEPLPMGEVPAQEIGRFGEAPTEDYIPLNEVEPVPWDSALPRGEVPGQELPWVPPTEDYIPPVFKLDEAPTPITVARAKRAKRTPPPPARRQPGTPVEDVPALREGTILPDGTIASEPVMDAIPPEGEYVPEVIKKVEPGTPTEETPSFKAGSELPDGAVPPVQIEDVVAPLVDTPAGPDREYIRKRSLEGYNAKELAEELGANLEEIRLIRKELGISNADVVEARKKRFAKPGVKLDLNDIPLPEPGKPAFAGLSDEQLNAARDGAIKKGVPETNGFVVAVDAELARRKTAPPSAAAAQEGAQAPVAEAPATLPERDPLVIAQEFLVGKKTVLLADIRQALKDGGVKGTIKINETIRHLENLGVISKGRGKERIVRPSSEITPKVPAAASTAEAVVGKPEAPATTAEPPGIGKRILIALHEYDDEANITTRLTNTGWKPVRGKRMTFEVPWTADRERDVRSWEASTPMDVKILEAAEKAKPAMAKKVEAALEPTPVQEPTPLPADEAARQALYIDPATGQIRPEVMQQVKGAARYWRAASSIRGEDVVSEMLGRLPAIAKDFDPALGTFTHHVNAQLRYAELKAYKARQKREARTDSLDAPAEEGATPIEAVADTPTPEQAAIQAARTKGEEKAQAALQEVLAELTPAELKLLGDKFGPEGKGPSLRRLGEMWSMSHEGSRKKLSKILTRLATKLREKGISSSEGSTPDSQSLGAWILDVADRLDANHPIPGTDFVYVDTPHLPTGEAAALAATREVKKLGSVFARLFDLIQDAVATPNRGRFQGFTGVPDLLGSHIGQGPTRANGRVYLNLLQHALNSDKGVPSLRPHDLASNFVDTLIHEALHNRYSHAKGTGSEFRQAEIATLDRMARDGTYVAAVNSLKQTLTAHDSYLLRWLDGQAARAEKSYVRIEGPSTPLRGADPGGTATARDRSGAGSAEAGAGDAGGLPSGGAVSGSAQREALELVPGARLRDSGATPERKLPSADRLRVEARLDDDPVIRAMRDSFTDRTLKDVNPIKLMAMMPEISGKIMNPELMRKLMDAYETLGPSAPNAKPKGIPDISLNLSRLITDDDLKHKLSALDQVLKEAGLQLRNTTEHWATTDELVDALRPFKNNRDLMEHVRKNGLTQKELTLLRMMHVFQGAKTRLANDTWRATKTAFDGAAEKGAVPGALSDALSRATANRFIETAHLTQLSLDLSGEKTKIGRLLSSLRRPVDDLDPHLANFSQHSRFLYALKEQGVQKDAINKMHQLLTSTHPKAYEEFQALLRESMHHTKWEQVMEGYVAGLVSGVPTKLANLTSNLAFRALRDAENVLATGLDTIRVAIVPGSKRERFLGEAAAAWAGYRTQIGTAMQDWAQGHGEIAMMRPLSPGKGLGFISGTQLDQSIRGGGKIPGRLGEVLRLGFKSLEVDDGLFKHLGGSQELFRRIYRQGRSAGLNHADAMAGMEPRFAEIQKAYETGELKELGKDTLTMLKDVNRQTLADTFQGELHGSVFKEIAHKIQLITNVHPSLKLFAPFIKTPANIYTELVKRTPMGIAMTIYDQGRGKFTGGQFAEELSKGILGTVIGGGVAMMAYEHTDEDSFKNGGASDTGGWAITGAGPLDPRLNAQLRAANWVPYSFKINGRYVPYNRFEPVSSILGIAADMAYGVRAGEISTDSVNKAGKRILDTVARNITNKTFISGLSAAFAAWNEPDRNMERFVGQLSTGFIPLSGLSRTMTRALDPNYRDVSFDNKAGVLGPIASNLPGVSKLLPTQYDPSGRPRERPGSNAFERAVSPIPTEVEDRSPRAAVLRLMTDVGYAPSVDKTFQSKKFGRVDLTESERATLFRAHDKANRLLEGVIRDPTFQSLPDNRNDPASFGGRKTKADIIRNIHDRMYQAALKSLLPELTKRALANRPK